MRKREREITLLYGMSLVRDDVLNHPVPKTSTKDRALIAVHFLVNMLAISSLIMPVVITIMSFIP